MRNTHSSSRAHSRQVQDLRDVDSSLSTSIARSGDKSHDGQLVRQKSYILAESRTSSVIRSDEFSHHAIAGHAEYPQSVAVQSTDKTYIDALGETIDNDDEADIAEFSDDEPEDPIWRAIRLGQQQE